MNDPPTDKPPTANKTPDTKIRRRTGTSRRTFLRQLAAVSALGVGGAAAARSFDWLPKPPPSPEGFEQNGHSTPPQSPHAGGDEAIGRLLPGAVDERILVVVDLQGGNDGLSTLVPAGDGRYYDLRPTLAIAADEVLSLDNEVGLHPSLARLHRRGITTVEGVGPQNGDLSHFAMTERWQRGDPSGSSRYRTGFLGRLIDAVDDGSPLVGVSMAGPTPYLLSQRASALSLEGLEPLDVFRRHDWDEARAWIGGVEGFAGGSPDHPSELEVLVAQGYGDLLDLAPKVNVDNEVDWDHQMLAEGGELGRQLYLASELLTAQLGVRVVYTAMSGFDTHQNHRWAEAENLGQVDAAVEGFLQRVEATGLADRVLVATITEFGRRAGENDSGLDHGTASTMIMAGPVADQRAGERPDLSVLDDDGNVGITVGFDRYLASLAQEWMGVEAGSVLPDDPEPLGLI